MDVFKATPYKIKNGENVFKATQYKTVNGSKATDSQYDDDYWEKYKEFANSEEASQGWLKYLADQEAKKQSAEEEKEEETWWEKIGRWLGSGGAVDTSLPMGTTTQTMHSLRDTGLPDYTNPEDDWEDEQRNIFGYLYSTNPTEASKYAKYLNTEAKEKAAIQDIQDSATSGFWAGAGNTAGAIATAPLGLADFLNDLVLANAGVSNTQYDGVVSPFEYSQAVTGGISEDLNEKGGTLSEDIPIIGGKGWGDLYGLGTSIAQSAASGYTLGGLGTLVSYFGQVAASGVDDALSRGASEEQAIVYGSLVGLAEGVAESIGVEKLFKMGASPTRDVLIKNVLKQAGAEGIEEGLTTIMSNAVDDLVMKDKSNFNAMVNAYVAQGMTIEEAQKKAFVDSLEGILYDAAGGFVSGGVHAGVHTGVLSAIDNHKVSQTYGDNQSIQDLLVDAANTGGKAGTVADKLIAKYGKKGKLSGANLNELIHTTDTTKMRLDIEAKLIEHGETGNISAISDVLVRQAMGEELSSRDWNTLNKSKAGHLVSAQLNKDNIKSGALNDDWATYIGTERLNPEVYNRGAYDLSKILSESKENVAKASVAKELSESGGATEANISVSDNGKNMYYDAETDSYLDADIKRIVSTKGGIKVELENGKTVKASELRFATREEGVVYEMLARMDVTPETANEILNTFKPSNPKQASLYYDSIPLAYRMGLMGNEQGLKYIRLSDAQKRILYNRGRIDATINAKERDNARATSSVKATAKASKTGNNGIIYEDDFVYDEASANDLQKAGMAGAEVIAKITNLEVHVFESKMVDGKRVAYVNGKRVAAPNGYFTDGNKIYIDINAGMNAEGAMLYALAHEVTHYIRKWNAQGFKDLADFLIAEYGKYGVDVTGLISRQKDKIKKRYTEEGKTLPSDAKLFDMAYEELVADAMSDMLADPKAYEKLAKLKKKNFKVWKKLGEIIKGLIDKLKNALNIYKKDSPVAVEAYKVRDFTKEAYDRLQDLYIKAFVEADNNYSSAEQTLAESGIAVNTDTDSASLFSVRDVLTEEQRQKVASTLATRFGVTKEEAMDWLKAETSMASLILNPKYSQYLDYTPDPNEVAIKTNSDYPQGTVDFSPICAKRREFTSVMNNILRLFPNHVFAATDLAKIRTIMQEEGMTIPCGICYVEDRRQLDTIVAQNFIDSLKLYREGSKTRPDGKPFNVNQLKGLSLIDGDSYIPSVYELVSLEGLNVLKEKNPNMAEAWVKFNNARGMQSVRLLANEAEYKRQILKYTKKTVQSKNDHGGLRVYSFSDAEMFHLIDIIQVITDSATVGLSLQGYTKVNEYAKAVKDTGEKLNRSLIPKGELGYHIENGKVVLDYDTVEGIDINHPDFFDNRDNPNVGNITIGVSDVQIRAAMVSDFVDQIIPFHTGQSEEVLGEKGISTWSNYKDFQTEKDIATGKVSEHQINIYTEVLQVLEKEGKPITKRTFVEKFLQVCKDNGLTPRFSQFLNTNENGEYVYTEGYHKMLVDFKTFAQTEVGEYLPQMPVKPIFDNEYITKILKDYVKSQKVKDAELAESMPKVIERITNEIVKPSETQFSDGQVLFSVREEYVSEIDEWSKDGMPDGETFVLGTTGDILQGLGAIENDIYLQGDKIKEILSAHPEMTLDEIKKIPQILENPILILKSRNVGRNNRENTRVVIFGSVKAKNGLPILSVMDLRPTENHIVIDDMQKVTSAYTKTNNPVEFIRNSDVLYADKKKPTSLLRTIGFQMPIELNKSGFVGSISYSGQNVNISGEKFSDVFFEGSSDGEEMHSDRDTDAVSNRTLLANALETVAQNDIEKTKLTQYKEKIALIESEQAKLNNIKAEANSLRFTKGRTAAETKKMRDLDFEANQTANRINTYDKQLLNLESTKALKNVLEREKTILRKRLEKQGKEALKAQSAKNAETVREIMNRNAESRKVAVEGRHKTEMRHKIKGIVKELNTLLLNPTAKKHIKEELRKEVADALLAINMDTVGADERVAYYNNLIARQKDPDVIAELTKTRDRIQLQGDNLQEKLATLQMAYEKIKNTDDIELNLAYQEVIHNSIKTVSEKVGKTSIRNMTLEQLEMVYDLFKMIRHTIRDANKAFKTKKGETIMQMAEAVNDQVRTVGGQPYKRNAFVASLQRMGWTFLKPFVAFRTIGSVTLTNMYRELRNGEDTFYVDVKEAQSFIESQKKKHNYKSWDMKKTKAFTAKSDKSFDLTLEQMMSLYAYSKREQAHDHIIGGGIVFEDALLVEKNKLGIPIKYEVTTKDAFNLSEETFAEIANSLTEEQKAFVDEMQAYLSDTMGAKGNEVSMELLGVKLFKEKSYLPIKSSQYYMNFKSEEAGEVKLRSPAFSKETVKHANNPIVLHNFTDLWAEHINDMSMYHSFVLALEDFTKVYNYKTKTDAELETMDTKATLETAYPGVTKYINKFLKDMNGGVRSETVGWADKLTSLSKKGAVLGSLSVAIQQPSAVMRAMAYINPKYFVTTAHKSLNLAKHKEDWAELRKYAPIAGIKEMGRFDVGMGQETVDWIKADKTAMDKAEEFLSLPPAFMDEVTWISIWNAVKKETTHNNPTLKTNSEEFLKLAGERFTEIISLSQVYDSVFSRSDLMRNKSWIAKSLTAFMAEPTTTLNMIWDSWVQAKRTGSVKGYAKAVATTGAPIVAATVLNAALKSIIMAMRDDDEDESYGEKYLEHFFGDLKDSLNPLTLVPFAKDVVSIFNGYDVERMDMALISDLKSAIDAFDSDSKTEYEKWSGLIGAISSFFGIPVKNVERDVRGLINSVFGETEETTVEGMLDAIKEGWTGNKKTNTQQLYKAMVSGDQTQISRIRSRYANEQAFETAMRQALRDNDSRIKEAAQARYDGNISEYTRIARSIIAEGNFSQDIVVGAINAEINAIKRGETIEEEPTEDEDEVTSIYSGSDINAALDNGDNQLAQEIIADLIETKVANGMTEKEAKSSLRSSMTSYWKPLYMQAYKSGNNSELARIRRILYSSGLYGTTNDVVKTTQNWLKS